MSFFSISRSTDFRELDTTPGLVEEETKQDADEVGSDSAPRREVGVRPQLDLVRRLGGRRRARNHDHSRDSDKKKKKSSLSSLSIAKVSDFW